MSDVDERPAQVGPSPALTADERAELQRLRHEVTELRAAPPRARRPVRWASLGSAVLLVLGLLLVPVSVLAVWTDTQVSDTDRFVATVSPVVADPSVQAALADRVTTEVFTRVDVQQVATQAVDALAAQGLPPLVVDRLRDLTGPLADATRGFVREQVGRLVASPQFVAAVQEAIAVSHQQIRTVLAGESAAIVVEGDSAVLDLYPFIEAAKQRLVESGFALAARIPEVHPTVELFPASYLVRAQGAYRALDAAATWLPWITVLALVGGVLLARYRRRATLVAGVGVMVMMVVLAAALLVTRGLLVGAVADQAAAPAAATFDIVVRFLRLGLRMLFVVGLLVALAAWVTGPSPAAVGLRAGLSRGVARLRRGSVARALQEGPVGPWVHDHRGPLRVAVVLLAALTVVFLDRPTAGEVVVVAVVLVVLLGVVEFLDQPRPAEQAGADGGPVGPVATGAG